MHLPVLRHQCLRSWSVTVRLDGVVSEKRLVFPYLSRSCGTVVVLPVATHLLSYQEEVPPRWYQAVGVLLGQPSSRLGNDSI
jgi:hypothetical protein